MGKYDESTSIRTELTEVEAAEKTAIIKSGETNCEKSDDLSGILFRIALLALLSIQTAAAVLLARYTKSSIPVDQQYESSHLLLVIDVVKIVCSGCLESYWTSTEASGGGLTSSLRQHVWDQPGDAMRLSIPASLFWLQSNLIYIALQHLSAPMFLTTSQTKVVATAMVSLHMIPGRRYTGKQWVCMILLTIGVVVVILDECQLKNKEKQQSRHSFHNDSEQEEQQWADQNIWIGLLAIAGNVLSSAVAGVYVEKVIKWSGASTPSSSKASLTSISPRARRTEESSLPLSSSSSLEEYDEKTTTIASLPLSSPSLLEECDENTTTTTVRKISIHKGKQPASLWMRNIQLSFFSFLIGVIRVTWQHKTGTKPFFHGFSGSTWVLVALQAAGGLIVAAVLKYTDSVLKTLSMAVAIVLASAWTAINLQQPVSLPFCVGAFTVMASCYVFTNPNTTNFGMLKNVHQRTERLWITAFELLFSKRPLHPMVIFLSILMLFVLSPFYDFVFAWKATTWNVA